MAVNQNYGQLSPYQQLFIDAWVLFKATFVQYLRLIGFFLAFFILFILIGVLLLLPIIFSAVGTHFQILDHLTPFTVIILILLFLWILLYIVSWFIASVVFPIASIFILQGKQSVKILELVKQSKPFFWAYFLTSLLGGLLILGGTMLLIIPGILIAFFMAFISYEIVIDGKSGTTALKRSYFMVKNYFWDIVGRVLVLEVGVIIISSILSNLSRHYFGLSVIQFLFAFFVSWYTRAYVYLLYKQVRDRTTFPAQISIRWVWIVSAIGWVVLLLIVIAAISGIAHLPAMQPPQIHKIPRPAA